MHIKGFLISLVILLAFIFILDHKMGKIPPLGKFLSPQTGFWKNAEPVNRDFSGELKLPDLKQPVEVWLDERMVPHIFAGNAGDAYYVQGYLTARDRLWQMEMQIRAANGTVSEILGKEALRHDREERRKGMVTAAEKSLAAMEADSVTREMLDTYTKGVNAYIATLSYDEYPIEYKLLDYKPEPWTPLKTALLMKLLAEDLTGSVDDFENTNALKHFSLKDFNKLFPVYPDSLHPIVPRGTLYYRPSIKLKPAPSDSQWVAGELTYLPEKPDKDNGSNNWAVSAKKSSTSAAILANDPHLSLNLPSLWYEIQIHTPHMNVYGVSLPGAPGVIIGFNNRISWGLTNAMRDVMDFYSIKFKDNTKRQYWYDGQWKDADLKVEKIRIRGGKTFYDTVAYTVFGPVMYDQSFRSGKLKGSPNLAIKWTANDSTNELKSINLMNRARNYEDYKKALTYFAVPGQNFIYADVNGDIGIWEQGKFPVRWKDQGKFILPGQDGRYNWQGYIPFEENPHTFAPARGYLFSANQNPTDSTYPYAYFGNFIYYRAQRIDEFLKSHDQVTVQDMMELQRDYKSDFAAVALPFMLKNTPRDGINGVGAVYMDSLRSWDYRMVPQSLRPTVFNLWWTGLKQAIWADDLNYADSLSLPVPTEKTTIEWLMKDPGMKYVDNRYTPEKETLPQLLTESFKQAVQTLDTLKADSLRWWGNFQGASVMHLTNLPAFSYSHVFKGGSRYTVNANKQDSNGKTIGSSWRMIVQMSNPVEAYGVYPGGQSGNPGSRYYDDFMKKWSEGEYNRLLFFQPEDKDSKSIRYRIKFIKE